MHAPISIRQNLPVMALAIVAVALLVAIYFAPTWWVALKAPNYPPEAFPDGDTTCLKWDCAVPTVGCTVDGLGHSWPGGRNSERTDADATLAGWRWFERIR